MQFLLNTPNLLHIDGEKKLSFIVQCAFLQKMTKSELPALTRADPPPAAYH